MKTTTKSTTRHCEKRTRHCKSRNTTPNKKNTQQHPPEIISLNTFRRRIRTTHQELETSALTTEKETTPQKHFPPLSTENLIERGSTIRLYETIPRNTQSLRTIIIGTPRQKEYSHFSTSNTTLLSTCNKNENDSRKHFLLHQQKNKCKKS